MSREIKPTAERRLLPSHAGAHGTRSATHSSTLLGPPPHARPHDLAVDAPAAYDCGGAPAATGYSVDVTSNAVKAGTSSPVRHSRRPHPRPSPSSKPTSCVAWVSAGEPSGPRA